MNEAVRRCASSAAPRIANAYRRSSPSHTMLVDPLTLPTLAEMVALPSWYECDCLHITNPADTVATLVALEYQFAVAVTSFVTPDAK